MALVTFLAIAYAQDQDPPRTPASQPYGPVALLSVVDGDTIVVESNLGPRTVRLIGVDAPEMIGNDPNGKSAVAALIGILGAGKLLWVETDFVREDIYGRLLAYVYVPDAAGVWDITGVRVTQANLALAESGWGRVLAIAPNVTYADLIAEAVAMAKTAERGLWAPGPSAEDAVTATEAGTAEPDAASVPIRLFCALFNPDAPNDQGEWVAVLLDAPMDTRGYYLYDQGSQQRFRLPSGEQPAGELRVTNPGQGVWNNSGDVVYLMLGDEVIDSWRYAPEAAAQGRIACR